MQVLMRSQTLRLVRNLRLMRLGRYCKMWCVLSAQKLITENASNVLVALGGRVASSLATGGGRQGRDVNAGGGSGFLPRAATGIYGTFGGNAGTDNNVLSLNGNPFLRVSRQEDFEVIPQGKSGRGGGSTNVYEVNAPITVGLGTQQGIQAQFEAFARDLPNMVVGIIQQQTREGKI